MAVVTVFGASGYIGSNLIPQLIQAGHTVRAVARNKQTLEGRPWPDVQLFAGDVLDISSLDSPLSGTDVAIYLVHSMGSGKSFEQLDRKAAENFA